MVSPIPTHDLDAAAQFGATADGTSLGAAPVLMGLTFAADTTADTYGNARGPAYVQTDAYGRKCLRHGTGYASYSVARAGAVVASTVMVAIDIAAVGTFATAMGAQFWRDNGGIMVYSGTAGGPMLIGAGGPNVVVTPGLHVLAVACAASGTTGKKHYLDGAPVYTASVSAATVNILRWGGSLYRALHWDSVLDDAQIAAATAELNTLYRPPQPKAVSWAAPASDGGSALTGYRFRVRRAGVETVTDLAATVTSQTLLEGAIVQVRALNGLGASAPVEATI